MRVKKKWGVKNRGEKNDCKKKGGEQILVVKKVLERKMRVKTKGD